MERAKNYSNDCYFFKVDVSGYKIRKFSILILVQLIGQFDMNRDFLCLGHYRLVMRFYSPVPNLMKIDRAKMSFIVLQEIQTTVAYKLQAGKGLGSLS